MGVAVADLAQDQSRITLRTKGDFNRMLAACKAVPGGRFSKDDSDPHWHYPTSPETCLGLRAAFGPELTITNRLARWYRVHTRKASRHAALGAAPDAPLESVSAEFSAWLRGSQRAGARWMAEGYRGAGLVGDVPGLGKTPQTLAALIEMGISGPVLVVCPKNAVRLTWGAELARHLPTVPRYLCVGKRAQRERVLARFARDMAEDPDALRIVVVVSEMLRVEMGKPCMTPLRHNDEGEIIGGGNRVPKCEKLLYHGECGHDEDPTALHKKTHVPIAFTYPELFQPAVMGEGWATIVLDESHKLLGSLTISKGNLMGRGLKLLPLREKARRYALSGTPFGKGGRVEGMFGTLHWLWPDEYTSFWKWADALFEIEEKTVDRYGKTVRQIKGLKGVGNATDAEEQAATEAFLRSLGPRLLRRTKAEILTELPPKQYLEVVCPLSPVQEKQYRQLADFAEVSTPGGTVMANGALALLTRARQIAFGAIVQTPSGKPVYSRDAEASGKMERLWEKLEERGILDGAAGPKIVIASEWNTVLALVLERLKADHVPYYHFDGSTSENSRDRQVEQWQNNLRVMKFLNGKNVAVVPRVFVVNSKAAGISINLDAADEMHMLDEAWNPEENEQMEDRIHRASRNHSVTILYYRTEGTIDYARAHSVEMKRRAQHMVLDGRRGLEYVREMLVDSLAEKEEV